MPQIVFCQNMPLGGLRTGVAPLFFWNCTHLQRLPLCFQAQKRLKRLLWDSARQASLMTDDASGKHTGICCAGSCRGTCSFLHSPVCWEPSSRSGWNKSTNIPIRQENSLVRAAEPSQTAFSWRKKISEMTSTALPSVDGLCQLHRVTVIIQWHRPAQPTQSTLGCQSTDFRFRHAY